MGQPVGHHRVAPPGVGGHRHQVAHRPARQQQRRLLAQQLGHPLLQPVRGRVEPALLVATALKVFLYDLGELRDLYRVASLLGLAVSLLGVSFAYQRFVRDDAARATGRDR